MIPMWDEERMRCSGNLPERPGSPPRKPGPLCQTVEDVRAQFQVLTAFSRNHVVLLDSTAVHGFG